MPKTYFSFHLLPLEIFTRNQLTPTARTPPPAANDHAHRSTLPVGASSPPTTLLSAPLFIYRARLIPPPSLSSIRQRTPPLRRFTATAGHARHYRDSFRRARSQIRRARPSFGHYAQAATQQSLCARPISSSALSQRTNPLLRVPATSRSVGAAKVPLLGRASV